MPDDLMTAEDVKRIEIELADAKSAGLMGRTNRLARVLTTYAECERLRQENERILAQNAASNNRLNEAHAAHGARLEENTQLWASIGHRDVDLAKARDEIGELTAACDRWRCDAQGFHDIAIGREMDLRELRRQLTEKTEECDRLRADNTHLRAEKATIWSTINSPAEQP